jgi:hypothetical protein
MDTLPDSKWLVRETSDAYIYGFKQGSPEWHKHRCIGGSVISAAIGASRYMTREEAIAGIIHPRSLDMTTPIIRGLVGEDVVRKYISLKTGVEFEQVGMAISKKYPWMRASPDGIYTLPDGKLGILEIKIISSQYRSNIAIAAHDKDPIFIDHLHQVNYTAGIIGATEITYATLLWTDECRILVRRFAPNMNLFERIHVPKAREIYNEILECLKPF